MSDKEDKKLPYDTEDGRELFDNLIAVASTTECTGLIPAALDGEQEITSYSEIYDVPLSQYRSDELPHQAKKEK